MDGMLSKLWGAAVIALALALSQGAARADVGPNVKLDASGVAFANVSISVADLDRSTKFYQALGFEAGDAHPLPGAIGKTLGATGADPKLEIRFLRRDGVVLELIHFATPPKKPASTGAASQLGLAHIAFRVDDVDRVAAIIKQNGGRTLDRTRTRMGEGAQGVDILFCADPDGVRIEVAGPIKG